MNKFQLLFGSFKVTILHNNCKLSSDKNDQKAKKNAMVQRERTKSEALPNLGVFEARPAMARCEKSNNDFIHVSLPREQFPENLLSSPSFSGGSVCPKCKLHVSGCFWGVPWKCKLTFWRYFEDPPHKKTQKRPLGDVQRPILHLRGGPKKCILHFGMVRPWKVALKV